MTHKDSLCHLAKKLNVESAGMMKKIEALPEVHLFWDFHEDNEPTGNVRRKTRHCLIRSLDVLFSGNFAGNFGQLGDVATAS